MHVRWLMVLGLGCAVLGLTAAAAREPIEEEKLPLLMVATAKIKPDQREAFIKAATACAEASRKEPGCVSYSFYEDPTEKGSFLYFEEWKDLAAIDEHFKAPHTTAFFAALPAMLAGPPTIYRYRVAERKKL